MSALLRWFSDRETSFLFWTDMYGEWEASEWAACDTANSALNDNAAVSCDASTLLRQAPARRSTYASSGCASHRHC